MASGSLIAAIATHKDKPEICFIAGAIIPFLTSFISMFGSGEKSEIISEENL